MVQTTTNSNIRRVAFISVFALFFGLSREQRWIQKLAPQLKDNNRKAVVQKQQRVLQSVELAEWITDHHHQRLTNNTARNNNSSTTPRLLATPQPPLLGLEVERISHDPFERRIVVELFHDDQNPSTQRRCLNPKILGRLSGPHAALVNWEDTTITAPKESDSNKNQSGTVNRIVGHYSVPSPGRYFVEIISLFCNGPKWNESIKEVCMEDPATHRLTKDTAFIDVAPSSSSSSSAAAAAVAPSGYWKWSPYLNQTDDDQQQQRPLLTRYQPQNCRDDGNNKEDRCTIAMSRDRFEPYQFFFNEDDDEQGDVESRVRSKLEEEEGGNTPRFCFVGLSHARQMAREANLWLQEWNVSAARAKNIDAQFPRLVDPRSIRRAGCTATVIACGQWSAGRKPPGGKYRGLGPTGFPEYRREVREMIARLRQANLTQSVALRSIHYNALGDVKTTCPPKDWRSPPVIDAYNDILLNLSATHGLPYIDTNFIVGPLWDISEDFCHYKNDRVARAEALYVLSRLLL